MKILEMCSRNDSLKKAVVYQWHEQFKSAPEWIEDDELSDRPSTSKIDEKIVKLKGARMLKMLDKCF